MKDLENLIENNLMKCSFNNCILGGYVPSAVAADVGFTVLRMYAGVALALAHGWGKIPPNDGFISGVSELGFPAPVFFAWAAGLSEFAGGLLLAAGLFTRPAAFFVLSTMLVAAFLRHASDPFLIAEITETGKGPTKEFALLYGSIALAFFLGGAGRFSVDALIRR